METTEQPKPKSKRGRPRLYSTQAIRFTVRVDRAAIDAWHAAGGTKLSADVAKAFAEKYLK